MSPKASNGHCRPMAIDCGNIRRARPLLGTVVEIQWSGASKADLNAGIDAAFDAVAKVHRLMSFHEPDSDVSRLNQEAFVLPITVHDWTYQVLQAAVEMHRRSNGMFDIAVAPELQAMGLLPGTNDQNPIDADARAFDPIELLEGQQVRFRQANV